MDPSRRLFLRGRVATPVQARPRPPWAVAEPQFLARCTRCAACVPACPGGLLTLGDGGYPEISFARQGCDACGACSRACPSGAIGPTTGAPFAWRVQVSEACLARQQVECRLCGDFCDTRALRFVPTQGGISQLQLDPAACTGCGACVAPCPVGALRMQLPEGPLA